MKRLLLVLCLFSTSLYADVTGRDGGQLPAQGNMIGGKGADGKFHYLLLGNDGAIGVTAPLGGATEAKQDDGNASLVSILSALADPATEAKQDTQITSLNSIDTKLGGVATSANQTTELASLSSIDTKTPVKGANTAANSQPVTMASDQAAILIRGPLGTPNGDITRSAGSTSSATWVAARATRRCVTLANLDLAITVYYNYASEGAVTTANGFPLGPGQSKTLNVTSAIQVIAASGTPALVADEEYD